MIKYKLCVMICCFLLFGAMKVCAETTYTFWPQEDAWANQDNPTANYGSATYLSVKDRSSLTESYLKFSDADMALLAGVPLASASLFLYQYQGTYSPGDAINIRGLISAWNQGSVTWDSRPGYGGAVLSSLDFSDGVVEGWREWKGLEGCVASWVNGQNFGLALENNKDLVNNELFARFYSCEAAAGFKPYLKVTAAPEPVSMLLFGVGAVVFGAASRLKKKKAV